LFHGIERNNKINQNNEIAVNNKIHKNQDFLQNFCKIAFVHQCKIKLKFHAIFTQSIKNLCEISARFSCSIGNPSYGCYLHMTFLYYRIWWWLWQCYLYPIYDTGYGGGYGSVIYTLFMIQDMVLVMAVLSLPYL